MSLVCLRLYAELNDFLPLGRRGVAFEYPLQGTPSVEELMESLGVPVGEIDLVLVDGQSVDLSYRIQDGARVSVYPVFESFDIQPVARVRSSPLRQPRFVLDVHLGRLARYLRMLGFDASWGRDWSDRELVRLSVEEHRILLSRDRALLGRKAVSHGHWVRETSVERQLPEILERFDLHRLIVPFTRCLCCNFPLQTVAKEEIAGRVPPQVYQRFEEYRICLGCNRVYWKGTHYLRMLRRVDELDHR